jgi:hypothetical protein
MNWATIWHLFRSDTRRLRWLIVVVWGLLLCEAVQFGSAGPWQQPSTSGGGSSDVPDVYNEYYHLWIPGFGLAAAILASSVGWLGVAAMRLRPARRSEVGAAKFLFLTVWLFLPQVVAIISVLRLNGIALPLAISAACGAASVFVPLWLVLAAYGRLAGSPWRLLGALGISLAVLAWLAVLIPRENHNVFDFLEYVFSNFWGERMGVLLWWWSGLSMSLLILLVWWTPNRWKPAWRCAAGSGGLLVLAWLLEMCFKPQATEFVDLSAAVSAPDLAKITVTPPSEAKASFGNTTKGERVFVNAAVASGGLPEGVFCHWMKEDNFLVTSLRDSKSIVDPSPRRTFHTSSAFLPPDGVGASSAALLAALPPAAADYLKQSKGWRSDGSSQFVSLGSFPSESIRNGQSERMALDGNLTGLLYRYQSLVDISLSASPAQVPCHGGWLRWRTLPNANPKSLLVDLSMQYPLRGLGSVTLPQYPYSPAHYWRIFLYFPTRGETVPTTQYPLTRSGRLLGGGFTQRSVCKFEFSGTTDRLSASDLAEARLLILEPEIVGIVKRDLRASALPVEIERPNSDSSDFYYTLGPRTEPRYFFDAARTLRPDPATATPEEFGRWMQFCLAPHTMDEWQTAELAAWLPSQLDVMLRAQYEFRSMAKAMSQALPEEQRSRVISQIEIAPWLISVLRDRGWLPLAKDSLLKMLMGPNELSLEYQCAIASLQEPEAQDKLLATLERYGDMTLYNILRLQPGIEPRLTATVKRYFSRVTVHGKAPERRADYEYWRHLTALAMPLAHGLTPAKDDALALFKWLGTTRNNLTEVMAASFHLPFAIKRDSKEATQYFLKLRPEDCQWDAIMRQWIVNPQPQPE